MHTIEVDFEVYKQLTVRRATENVTYNDVICELLGVVPTVVSKSEINTSSSLEDWVGKGVRFPAKTEFRANYKGKLHTACVERGGLLLNGLHYTSPSRAAMSITGSSVNGWRFWECRIPGTSTWKSLLSMRS
jgi:hypothetical protein